MSIPVHLVTILFRTEQQLPPFLASLQAQDLVGWRLHAIDNASPDASRSVVEARRDPRIQVIANDRNLGFARAANQGLRAALSEGAQFVILINNDTVFAPDFLGRFVAARDRLGAGVIAPRILSLRESGRSWYAGGRFDPGWVFQTVHDEDTPDPPFREVEFATGCCLGLTRSVLERVGLLDERFFVYWEDTDYCMRLKQHHVPIIYVRDPVILHEGGSASGGEFSPSYIRLFYRSYIQFLRKHFGNAHALRAGLRIIAKEAGRRSLKAGRIAAMAWAMARGMTARGDATS